MSGMPYSGSIAPMSLATCEGPAKSQSIQTTRSRAPNASMALTRRLAFKFQERHFTGRRGLDTIVRWVDSGAVQGDPKDMPPLRQWNDSNEWKEERSRAARPDHQIEPYTMAASHRDVWWRPLSNIPLTEPRWLRAVEMRPGTLKGRRITHHAVPILCRMTPTALRLVRTRR
jgi:hypothetical protein